MSINAWDINIDEFIGILENFRLINCDDKDCEVCELAKDCDTLVDISNDLNKEEELI